MDAIVGVAKVADMLLGVAAKATKLRSLADCLAVAKLPKRLCIATEGDIESETT